MKWLFEELLSTSHVVYGLRLAASPAIPGLPLRFDSQVPDVRIWLRDLSAFSSTFLEPIDVFHTSPDVTAGGQPNLRVGLFAGGAYFGFLYEDGARFAVERRGREVWADWPENYSLEDACTYLLGPVMGFVLRLHGVVCLHASAVALGDRAFAIAGLPGAGKSTTAAAFASAGFPVLSDDIVALESLQMQRRQP